MSHKHIAGQQIRVNSLGQRFDEINALVTRGAWKTSVPGAPEVRIELPIMMTHAGIALVLTALVQVSAPEGNL
ncbi:hypothetical protein [Bradyrhizobium japonicum]|uniref:hypothetical protein n=1 Tax=Bradyrhizobium japonicum TaxID=375 RepID=UPI0004B786EA|nr:hypothetical protein [Bradyrhizobium japonicum]